MRRNLFVYFVLFFIVGVTAFGLIWGNRQDANRDTRREDLRKVAATLGFTFDDDGTDLRARFGDFDLFASDMVFGRSTMTGTSSGQPVAVTDFVRAVHTSRMAPWEEIRSVAIFPGIASGLPNFLLFPGGRWKSIDDRTNPPIAFAKTDKFAETYTVRGPDASAIQRVFGEKTRAFFSIQLGWRVEVHDGSAIVYRGDSLVAPADVPAFIADAHKVAEALRPR